ncbi:MAG: EAL domain-containing protein [Rudaea sp.]
MAHILIVDDRAVNLDFLEAVLNFANHRVSRAMDGGQALQIVREARPDLVITDVLMPNIGGVELADSIHRDPGISATPIIFYTAQGRDPEANVLAESCHVAAILVKPAEPQAILDTVAQVLGGKPPPQLLPVRQSTVYPAFLSAKLPAHMRDLADLQTRLRGILDRVLEGDAPKADTNALGLALQKLSLRTQKLFDLNLAVSSQSDFGEMLNAFCAIASDVMSCDYAGVYIYDADGERLQHSGKYGLSDAVAARMSEMDADAGMRQAVMTADQPFRARANGAEPTTLGLPDFHPPVLSLLAVPMPVRSSNPLKGWIYFANKADESAFDSEDEQFAVILALQLSLAYANLSMLDEVRRHAVKLELEVAARRQAQEELTFRASHDQVTGLPRGMLIEAELEKAIARATVNNSRVIVLHINVDHLHSINKNYGRATGDEVLRCIADRLRGIVAGTGHVAHVAGDEFMLVFPDPTGAKEQLDFADSVRARMEEPVKTALGDIRITCSVGVSCFPDNGATARELLHEAEEATQNAKLDGRNLAMAFSNERKQQLSEQIALGMQLREAIQTDQLILHYQPQINGLDWQILGFEALVRWQHPELGLLGPARFIPIAEELGLIVELGDWVLNSACRQIRAWLDSGADDFVVSINVSAKQFVRSNFVENLQAAIATQGVRARHLELELTESAMARRFDVIASSMKLMKRMGIRLALDDFGTGYSSLNLLRQFPLDRLKIDQGFVSNIASDASAAGICRAIISLGHQLGLKVTAEGVETAAQVGYLLRNECDEFQGYYFSGPVGPTVALDLLKHRYISRQGVTSQLGKEILLIVDDEENVLHALKRTLRRDGYEILSATNAGEAFELLAKNDVQVIVSDQRMPDCSGTDFLSQVKEMYPATVRMVLSGYTDLAAVTDAINRGAIYKFLTKPWNDTQLREHIREAFRVNRARDQTRAVPG